MRNASVRIAGLVIALAVGGRIAAEVPAGRGSPPAGKKASPSTRPATPDLHDPSSFHAKAPAVFKATFETTKGSFAVLRVVTTPCGAFTGSRVWLIPRR